VRSALVGVALFGGRWRGAAHPTHGSPYIENGHQNPHPLDHQSHTLALSEIFRATFDHA
jgi:hypothetical protein